MKVKGIGVRIDLQIKDNFKLELGVLSIFLGWSFIRIKVFISVAASGRNIGSVRNPLLLKGVTNASGKETIKIIKRAHL